MKDTLITAKRKKTELLTALACLGIAILINIGCIIWFHTPFYEVFTQIGYVCVIALGLYLIWTAIRLIVWLFRRNKK
jgi:1,4-dihydroxy-2-naphthoate octaprenyltransferase